MSGSAPARPLNILQVASGLPGWGGTELHLINLAEQLSRRGHRVTITAQPGGFVEKEAHSRGLPTAAIAVKRQWDWSDQGAVKSLLRREAWDVVHVHWSTDYVVTPWLARRAGIPAVVMSRHSPYPLKSALGRYLYDHVLFDRIIALSESVRTTLVGQGLKPEKIVTIHHGTDTDQFRNTTVPPETVREQWGIPVGGFLVGLAGRIAHEKGWRTFFEALAKQPDARGVLIGDGPERADAEAYAAQLNLNGRLTFAGFRSDVNNAMNALDALTLASTWAEPCAAVVQQAMALGKPVIGTDIGGTPEMIARDQTGFLVPPGDADALARAMRTLADDAALRQRMGEAGEKRAEELFTLRRMTDRNEALYRDVLAQKGR